MKLSVTAEHDHFDMRIMRFQNSRELLSVHDRHDNIGNDDMRLETLDHLQCLLAVCGFSDDLKAVLFPVQMMP